jgi:alkylation response protein AidB-like acyl-CoA dehydrogenase
MDIDFTTEQRMIQKNAREFLRKECNTEFVREMWEDEIGFPEKLWIKMVEMGWLGINIPEEYDGEGFGFLELGILLDEMGRVPMPGPYLSTVLVSELLVMAGSEEQKKELLPKIANGKIKAAIAIDEPDFSYGTKGIQLPAEAKDDGFVLNGKKQFVVDGIASNLLVVAARTQAEEPLPVGGVTLFLLQGDTPGLTKTPLVTMDGGRKQCEIAFENVMVASTQILGNVNQGWPVLSRLLEKGALAVALESLGGGQRALDMSVSYAKERVQFDRPIGSFQAVKHTCAQCAVEIEGSRSICYYAAWAMDHLGEEESGLLASVAKSYAGDMFRNVTADGIQVHGAIGVTWESDMHLYLKRAKMNESLFGPPTFHRERVAQLLNY